MRIRDDSQFLGVATFRVCCGDVIDGPDVV